MGVVYHGFRSKTRSTRGYILMPLPGHNAGADEAEASNVPQ
jgi:hypothetical protein